jgi:hypothetical protein
VIFLLVALQLTVDQLIQAPSPLQTFTHLHDKFCLIVGQGMVEEIAQEYLSFILIISVYTGYLTQNLLSRRSEAMIKIKILS